MIKNDLLFYIKTTETCNLNCSHCFTSGKNGRKIYFDPIKTAKWVNQIKDYNPQATAHFEFHGGEPFLAPIDSMMEFYELTSHWNATYGATSNLVFKLTDEKLEFMDNILQKRIGTSWDSDIRFANQKQKDLWESNVKFLLDRGYTIKLFISLTKSVIDIEPIELLKFVKELGVQELALERLTNNGSARKNPHIFPSNLELQHWFLKMYEQTKEHNARDWFVNEFLENVYAKFEMNMNSLGTFCRDCEQKLFTINADGGISGCPNSAPEQVYGHIDNPLEEVLNQPKRCSVIVKELTRNSNCYTCNMYKYCRGDCHQLDWEGDICAAPKFLMIQMDKDINGNTK
jgi:radical SAM protein with 4Fe4S-binding SPASM domain